MKMLIARGDRWNVLAPLLSTIAIRSTKEIDNNNSLNKNTFYIFLLLIFISLAFFFLFDLI